MYSSKEDLEKRVEPEVLIALTDDANTGEANEAIIAEAIADADAEIDTYLGNRYSVPLSEPPEIVKRLSAIVAIKNLFQRRPESRSPEFEQLYQQASALLKDIATGKIDLQAANDRFLPESTSRGQARIFGPDSLKRF